jgi:tetratricopeptide (TPR) repeat protein
MFERADKESILGSNVTEENLVPRLRVQGVTALFAGRFEEAVKLLEQSKQLDDKTIDWHLAMATYYAGDHERAEMMLAGIHGSAQTEQRAAATWASFLAARGEKERAKALLRSVGDYGYNDHHVAYSVGVTHAQFGNAAEALRWLSRAKNSGFPCYPWFEQDPLLQPIINDANLSTSWHISEKSGNKTRRDARTCDRV